MWNIFKKNDSNERKIDRIELDTMQRNSEAESIQSKTQLLNTQSETTNKTKVIKVLSCYFMLTILSVIIALSTLKVQAISVNKPGSNYAKEKVYYTVTSNEDDYYIGDTGRQFALYKGEKALLDKDKKILLIEDAIGRVKLENLYGDTYRLYAWDDGYDGSMPNVPMKSGYSYGFENLNFKGYYEVRLISDEGLIGYTFFNGVISYVDRNNDTIMSIDELKSALSKLHEDALAIEKSQPSLVSGFEDDISIANSSLNSLDIDNAYFQTKQLYEKVKVANEKIEADKVKKEKTNKTITYIGIVTLTLVLFLLLMKFLSRRRNGNDQTSLTKENEVKYVGGQKNGKQNGQGTYIYSNGDEYVGEWGNGYPWGQGTMKHANGDIYTGNFSGRKPNGQGVYTYANGDEYIGAFKDGKKNGQGTMTYADGTVKTGEWKDGEFVG